MPATLLAVTAGLAAVAVTATVAKVDAVAAGSAASSSRQQQQQELVRRGGGGRRGLRSSATNSWHASSSSLRSDGRGFRALQQLHANAAVSAGSSRRVRGVGRVQHRHQQQARTQQAQQAQQRHEERVVRAKAAVNVESAAVTDESTGVEVQHIQLHAYHKRLTVTVSSGHQLLL